MTDIELADWLYSWRESLRCEAPCLAATCICAEKTDQIIAALRRGHEPKRAMIDDVPLCAGHADWWFTSRNHLKGDTSCVVCAFNPERPPSGEMVEQIVRIVLQLGYNHWLRNGTAIKVEDAQLVLLDVRPVLSAAEAEGRKS